MKKITLLTVCMLLTAMVGAQDITFTFQNARNTNDGTDHFYEADIFIASTVDFKLGSGQVYFTYNTAAFGDNIDGNSNFEYLQPAGSILAETYSNFPAYQSFIANDNTNSRVSTSFQQGLSSGTITANNVTSTPKHLFSIRIKYADIAEEPMIAFETGAVFLDQFFTACGPATFGFPDCTNNPGVQLTNDTFDSSGANPSSDTTPPVISLIGNATVNVEAGTTYNDAGATATDDTDGDITADIVVVNPVDTSIPDIYTVTYNVNDAAGNAATEVTREVTVEDTTAPVISLIGNASVTVEAGTTYNDAGATAADSFDGDITADIIVFDPVDTSVPGVYTVTYNVNDVAGNVAIEVTREVTVADTTVPVISLTGSASVTIEAGTTYNDAGATAADSLDGDITADIVVVNPVDTSTPAVYTITYNVTDAAGNAAAEVIREVTVQDTSAPIIILNGSASVTVEAGTTYNDAGATASDALDGDITADIVVVNPVDTSVPGVYTVTYNVNDAAGNTATEVTREVTVEDTTLPVITLLGSDPVEIEEGGTYNDAGATAADSLDGDITADIVVVNPVDTSTQGSYTITYNVSDAAGNNAVEVTRTVNVVPPLSIEDNEIDGLEIYPNPVTNTLIITLPVKNVIVYNPTGQKILETTNNKIEMSSLTNGVYFVHVFTDKGNDVKRILKE